jgi:hypothetical protein
MAIGVPNEQKAKAALSYGNYRRILYGHLHHASLVPTVFAMQALNISAKFSYCVPGRQKADEIADKRLTGCLPKCLSIQDVKESLWELYLR